uniref:Alpha-1,6-mannosyl-glycoprotein 6-beta-N-acetylglucosaminyltransferase n=1 Tax=Phaeocystis antarctica TaxID=33657 RepID=A0A7S0HZ27_9EUKA|mmetsp:Transcript_39186/g.92101  ORF Transcript_39186/g.92101 Transcript_39186/m.92101 type:complete len:411 (+) Transcript_39186:46-1278(+)
MKALLALALASAAAAAQEEPATLAAIVQQMASLQQRVTLVETENADLRSELAAAKRQGPQNSQFGVSSLGGQSRRLGESPDTCCRWTPGETCQTTEEVCTMVHEYIEAKALTVEFLDATNAGCLGSDKDAWRASFDGSTANVTLSNAAGVVTTMATPLKVTHAVNCAAEQPTLTLQLPTEAASTLLVGGFDVAAALMKLGAKVADYDTLVAGLTPIAGCYSITDEATCIASKDNRDAHPNAPCTWCCGAVCTASGSSAKCQPFNYLLSGGTHLNGYIGTGTNGAGYNTCPPPPPPPPPPPVCGTACDTVCGTASSVEWHYGALGQDCNAVCSIAGKSCDANALTTHTRNTECNTALAANLGVTCNQGGYSSSAMRPGYNSGDGSCYYANPATTLDCAAFSSTNARFCPCS